MSRLITDLKRTFYFICSSFMLRKCCNILLALTAKQRETMLFLFGFFGFKMFLSFENNQ